MDSDQQRLPGSLSDSEGSGERLVNSSCLSESAQGTEESSEADSLPSQDERHAKRRAQRGDVGDQIGGSSKPKSSDTNVGQPASQSIGSESSLEGSDGSSGEEESGSSEAMESLDSQDELDGRSHKTLSTSSGELESGDTLGHPVAGATGVEERGSTVKGGLSRGQKAAQGSDSGSELASEEDDEEDALEVGAETLIEGSDGFGTEEEEEEEDDSAACRDLLLDLNEVADSQQPVVGAAVDVILLDQTPTKLRYYTSPHSHTTLESSCAEMLAKLWQLSGVQNHAVSAFWDLQRSGKRPSKKLCQNALCLLR